MTQIAWTLGVQAGSLPPPPEEDPLAAPEAAALYATGQGNEADRIGCAYSLGRRAWHGDDRALEALTNALADPSVTAQAVS